VQTHLRVVVMGRAVDGVGAVQHGPSKNGELKRISMFDMLLLFRCFPEVWRGRFGPCLCHFQPLALGFFPLLGGG
jgi:hypothetical protein